MDNRIKIEGLALGPLETNCYLLKNEQTQTAIVIDPGQFTPTLQKRLEDFQVEAILLTHAHFDHIGGLDELRKWKKCPVYAHDLEANWLVNPNKNGSSRYPEVSPLIQTFPAEYQVDHHQVLHFLNTQFQVLYTPGHSPGSVTFVVNQHVFSGDVLFRCSVGRTDLPGGNSTLLIDSIQRHLFSLPDEAIVYPGHGPRTTIGYEREHNPYM